MIHVFIGYDPRETVAYSVLAHSIQARASQPVSISPLRLSQLQDNMPASSNSGGWIANRVARGTPHDIRP